MPVGGGPMAERPKLGQLLLGAEVITEGQLAAALDEQKQTGRPLGMTLVNMGSLDEETLVRTLARQLRGRVGPSVNHFDPKGRCS